MNTKAVTLNDEYILQLARQHGSMHSTLEWLEKYANLDKIALDIVKGTLANVTSRK